MTKLTSRLAMLCMAVLLLGACGRVGHAFEAPTARESAAAVGSPAYDAASTAAPSAAPAPTTATNVPTATAVPTATPLPTPLPPTSFAVIGDNGLSNEGARAVAELVAGWKPDFIVDVGDLYYSPVGAHGTAKFDGTVGKFYCAYLKDITTTGSNCPVGRADRNRFFPALGNHEYSDAHLDNYLGYFDLPGAGYKSSSGNERYYDFTWGPIHFYALDSNSVEADGATADSKQARWLHTALEGSKSAWNIVYFHHPPYSSGATHGSQTIMRWPFAKWGAQAVISGHEHLYERIMADGMVYFVNGLGGGAVYPFAKDPVPGSAVRVNNTWGAQRVTATEEQVTFEFYTVDGKLRDSYTLSRNAEGYKRRLSLPMVLAP